MNNLRLPWRVEHSPDALSDVVYIVDCNGKEVATIFCVHSLDRADLVKHILDQCNPPKTESEMQPEPPAVEEVPY